MLYISDTKYCPTVFKGINHVLIEANYDQKLLDSNPNYIGALRDRVMNSHMRIDTTRDFIEKINNPSLYSVCLIHISSSNSDVERFKEEIEKVTYANVTVAKAGTVLELGNSMF